MVSTCLPPNKHTRSRATDGGAVLGNGGVGVGAGAGRASAASTLTT